MDGAIAIIKGLRTGKAQSLRERKRGRERGSEKAGERKREGERERARTHAMEQTSGLRACARVSESERVRKQERSRVQGLDPK